MNNLAVSRWPNIPNGGIRSPEGGGDPLLFLLSDQTSRPVACGFGAESGNAGPCPAQP